MRTVLTTAQRNARSLSFGSEEAQRPHSLPREVDDLRNDVESAFVAVEGKAGMPVISHWTGAISEAGGGTDSLVLKGANFLAGRAQASKVISGITFTAHRPGVGGNVIAIEIVEAENADDNLLVTEADNTVTITLGKDGDGALDPVKNAAADVVQAVNAASVLVSASQDGAAALSAAVSATSLEGGTGNGLVVSLWHGAGANPVDVISVSNTSISVKDDQLAAVAEGDVVGISVMSHTALSNIAHVIAGA
jgi:hypothetical protein